MSAKELGRIDDLNLTKWEAYKAGKMLNIVGINTNFAPVLDVNTNPNNPAIGKIGRAYSNNPKKVYDHAKAAIRGYQNTNILTALKHFPGHGSAFNDSHLGMTDITNTWDKSEMLRYAKLILENDADMIMMGHLFNSRIDKKYPASISKEFTDLIRDDFGYNGVLISDDMQMKAITDHYTLEEQVELFLDSSMDIILFGNNLDYDENIANKIFELIYNKAQNDVEMQNRIDASFNRILNLKKNLIK
jgi:beta-N-acetylhexosaminidase